MIKTEIGVLTPLTATLFDGAVGKGVRAVILRLDGTTYGAVSLPHQINGLYAAAFSPTETGWFRATFFVYTDGTYATLDDAYARDTDLYRVFDAGATGTASTLYRNRMSTALDNVSGSQEVICWAEADGQRVAATANCIIEVRQADGTLKYTGTVASPNADGVYKFTNPFADVADRNFYVVIKIDVNGSQRASIETFFTVG